MNKKAVSGVIVTVLLILLVIAAISIVAVVIIPFIQNNLTEGTQGLNFAKVNLVSAEIQEDNFVFKLRRDADKGDLSGVNLIFKDSEGESQTISKSQNHQELETKDYIVSVNELTEVDSKKIESVNIVPFHESENGKKYPSNFITEYQVDKNIVNKDQLILYLPLDGSINDASSFNRDTSSQGTAPTYISDTGAFGGSYSFNNGYIQVDDEFNYGESFTISVWIKPISIGAGESPNIVSKTSTETDKSSTSIFIASTSGNPLRGIVYENDANYLQTSSPSGEIEINPTSPWQHVVMTYNNEDKTLKIYKDGENVGTQTLTGTFSNYNQGEGVLTKIGVGKPSTTNQYFTGLIDEVKIYSRALSETEINYLMLYG